MWPNDAGRKWVSRNFLITPAMCRSARGALAWSAQQLADHAGIGRETVSNFERGAQTRIGTLQAILSAFASAGVEFDAAEDGRERVTYGGKQGTT
jgi:transcriptional regulator with XRE-family HTH domain